MDISVVITLHISAADSGAQNRAHYCTKSFRSRAWKLMTCCWKKESGIQSALEKETGSEGWGWLGGTDWAIQTEMATRNWNGKAEKRRGGVINRWIVGKRQKSKRVVIYSGCEGADTKVFFFSSFCRRHKKRRQRERKRGMPSGPQDVVERADEKQQRTSKSRVCRSRSLLIIRAQSLSNTAARPGSTYQTRIITAR